jgi:hypothetical protein
MEYVEGQNIMKYQGGNTKHMERLMVSIEM